MAVNIKLLAATGVSNSGLTDLNVIKSGKGWLVKNLMFYNYGSAGNTITVDLKIKQGGTYRMLQKGALVLSGGAVPGIIEKEIAIDLGNDILAVSVATSGTPASIDCVVNGVERDQ